MTAIKLCGKGRIALALLLFILLASQVIAIGVAPSRREIKFEPGKEFTVTAQIINNEAKDMKVLVLPQGTFASLVSMESNVVRMRAGESEKSFSYTVKLPDDENQEPGQHVLRVAFMELPDEFRDQVVLADGSIVTVDGEKATISATTAVIQQVIVNVPFPESFLQGKLYSTGNKVNEPVAFSVNVFNRGNVELSARGYLIVKGPTNEEIVKIDSGSIKIAPMGESRLVGSWEGTSNPGEYLVEAYVTYGSKTQDKSFRLSQSFQLGEPFLSIEGLSVKSFRLGSIAKFDVDVLNRWNKMIKDVKGEMRVIDKKGGVLDSFETTRLDIPSYGMSTMSGYWDTEGVTIGEYDVNIVLEYEGKTSQKLFETIVSIDKIDVKSAGPIGQVIGSGGSGNQYTLLIILVIVLIVFNILIFTYFRKLKSWFKPPGAGGAV